MNGSGMLAARDISIVSICLPLAVHRNLTQ
jgi:predicted dehydrogenase